VNLKPCSAYRSLLAEVVSDDDLQAIRTCLRQQQALGRDDFREMVEARTRPFAGIRPAHRPVTGTCRNK
jgi:putative transposase